MNQSLAMFKWGIIDHMFPSLSNFIIFLDLLFQGSKPATSIRWKSVFSCCFFPHFGFWDPSTTNYCQLDSGYTGIPMITQCTVTAGHRQASPFPNLSFVLKCGIPSLMVLSITFPKGNAMRYPPVSSKNYSWLVSPWTAPSHAHETGKWIIINRGSPKSSIFYWMFMDFPLQTICLKLPPF